MRRLLPTILTLGALAGGVAKAQSHSASREALRTHILAEWVRTLSLPKGFSGADSLQRAAAALPSGQAPAPATAKPFQAFSALELTWDEDFLFVGSRGWPDHDMMIGITAWQQQVPLPQAYLGENAWRLPLRPVPAKQPALIKGRFLRGAIALAVNGVPIFNPQNNRGEVSAEIGELDQWGGHCGRADDYHYHAAPLHLQAIVGKGQPIAYALDGYPIHGLTEPDGSAVGPLDECHGHDTPGVGYHYHASTSYPYILGGFHGEVAEVDGQVTPQPRAQPVREGLPPLRGAEITGFAKVSANSYVLGYVLEGEKRSIAYTIQADGTCSFEFNNGREGTVKETYRPRDPGKGQRPRPPREGQGKPPPR